jgi:hypothetical protein
MEQTPPTCRSAEHALHRIRHCDHTQICIATTIAKHHADNVQVPAPAFAEQEATACPTKGQLPGPTHIQFCKNGCTKPVEFSDSEDEREYVGTNDILSKVRAVVNKAKLTPQPSVLLIFPARNNHLINGVFGMPAALVVRDTVDETNTTATAIACFIKAWTKNATCALTGQQTAPPADTFHCVSATLAAVSNLVVTYSQQTNGYWKLPFMESSCPYNHVADEHLDAIGSAVKKHLPEKCIDDMAKGFSTERAMVVAAIQRHLKDKSCKLEHSFAIGIAAMWPIAGRGSICSFDPEGLQQLFAQDKGGFSSIHTHN